MNKFYLLSSLSFLILFTGCGPKANSLNHFQKDQLSANAIQYTKKRDLIYKNEPILMLFSTYLNNIDKKYQSDKLDSFIIGIHIINKENHDLIENRYEIFLNNQKHTSIVKLEKDSKLIKGIPLKNNWANYFLIHFKSFEKDKKLNLKLIHPIFGQVSLDFQK